MLRQISKRGTTDAYRDINGGNLALFWHTSFGIDQQAQAGEVTKWFDFVTMNPMLSSGTGARPAFAIDGPAFGGQKVVKCSTTGVRALRSTTIPATLLSAATRPYMLARIRVRTAAVCNLLGLSSAATAAELFPYCLDASTIRLFIEGADRVSGVAYNTTTFTFECWCDGTNANVAINGVATSAAYASATASASTIMALGVGANFTSSPADLSAAVILICHALPATAIRAQNRALVAAEFPA